jgi:hypothetical protein
MLIRSSSFASQHRQLAAETAEAVVTSSSNLQEGQRIYADVKARAAAAGRDPDHPKILPAAFVVIGRSLEEAEEKRATFDSLVDYDSSIASLPILLGTDASNSTPTAPCRRPRDKRQQECARACGGSRPPPCCTGAMVLSVLERGFSKGYKYAARDLKNAASVASRLPTDSGIPDHDAFVAGLKDQHGRKYGFWTLATGTERAVR